MKIAQTAPYNINFKGLKDIKNTANNLKSDIDEIQSDNNNVSKSQLVLGASAGFGSIGVLNSTLKAKRDLTHFGEMMKKDPVTKTATNFIEKSAKNINKKGALGKTIAKTIDNSLTKGALRGMLGIGAVLILGLQLLTAIAGTTKMIQNNQNLK